MPESTASPIARAIHAEPAEVRAACLAFAYFFCLMAGYYVLKPLRDQVGIAGGTDKLPWLFSATFVAMLLAVPAFGAVAARMPRHRFVPLTYRFFTAAMLVFWLFFSRKWAEVAAARAFFVWVSVYNLFVVSVFWSLMADLFSHEQGKRLFGFIAAGGSVGALAGPLLVTFLVKPLGPANLLLVSAVVLEAAVWCVHALHGWSLQIHGPRTAQEQPVGGTMLGGLAAIARSRFLLALCGYILLLTATATFLYFAQADIVSKAATDARTRTALFARIDLVVNVTTLILQAFITGRVVKRLGVRFGIAFLPVVTAAGFIALALSPTLVVIALVQGVRRAVHYGLERPSREILYTAIPREEKYKSKNFIDTVVYRGGDALSGWVSVIFHSALAAAAASLALCAVWLWNSLYLARSDEERA